MLLTNEPKTLLPAATAPHEGRKSGFPETQNIATKTGTGITVSVHKQGIYYLHPFV